MKRTIDRGLKKELEAETNSLPVDEAESAFQQKRKEEAVSIHQLLPEREKIINNPRAYQLELFERAKKENVIAVLDTGSGKTLIACLLLRYMMEEELERRTQGKEKRSSFFLVYASTRLVQRGPC